MKHLLSIQSLTSDKISSLVDLGLEMKRSRGKHTSLPLKNQCWALIFAKSSTRTRVSFEVGIRELGGDALFLSANEIQLGRGEPIEDTARVLSRFVHGAVIRTYAQEEVEKFATFSNIPTVNALTDEEHPCQILADLLTIKETRGHFDDMILTFIGDGDCNMARSWIWAAARCGFELRIAAPEKFQPPKELLAKAGGKISVYTNVAEAAKNTDVLYTDVWISMGKEEEANDRLASMQGYQINETITSLAPKAMVMHCLPAYRNKEITADVLEAHAETIFRQAENRLHAQKAVLAQLA